MTDKQGEKLTTIAIIFGAICLMGLAFAETFGLTGPSVRYAMLAGVVGAGTIMWVVQARKHCPHCGEIFGFSLRLLKPYECRKCGGDIRGDAPSE